MALTLLHALGEALLLAWEVLCPPERPQGLHAEQGRILPVVLWPWPWHGGLPRDGGISHAFSMGASVCSKGSVEQRQEGRGSVLGALADQCCYQAEC